MGDRAQAESGRAGKTMAIKFFVKTPVGGAWQVNLS